MVCKRCIMAVENVFCQQGYEDVIVSMGQVEIKNISLSTARKQKIDKELARLGFEIIDDKYAREIERIKNLVIDVIQSQDLSERKPHWPELINGAVPYEYKYISRLFSAVEGISIEQYIIRQKIEKVKELIIYDELSLSEISWRLGYSSVAHVSSQFKKVTGMSPSEFRETGVAARKALDKV